MKKYPVTILWCTAIALFIISSLDIHTYSTESVRRRVEKKLNKREMRLEKYIGEAFDTPATEWPDIKNFPEDMVLYKYVADTLQSWINVLPTGNDEVNLFPSWYRIHDMSNRNMFNTPLSYLSDREQYVNLGPNWYLLKIHTRGESKIISGILIKTQYSAESSILKNSINRKIGLSSRYNTVQIYEDDGYVVHSISGEPLFSIIDTQPLPAKKGITFLKWLAILLAGTAIIYHHYLHRNSRSLLLSWLALSFFFYGTTQALQGVSSNAEFFSPMVYADGIYFDSLAKLVTFNTYLFSCILLLFLSRKMFLEKKKKNSYKRSRIIKTIGFSLLTLFYTFHLHSSLRSLILNSAINLDISKINFVNNTTIIIYISYALLFLGLMFLIHIVGRLLSDKSGKFGTIFLNKWSLLYIICISIYTTAMLGGYGFKRECNNLRILTTRLATERDPAVEIQLQRIEKEILRDPHIKYLVTLPNSNNLIYNTIIEKYFWNISRNYYINITVCQPQGRIITKEYPTPVMCYNYFDNLINRYGQKLSNSSAFLFMDYFSSSINYMGVFSIIGRNINYNLYIEIESKETKENAGYPFLLLNSKEIQKAQITFPYSYAKYRNNRLITSSGRYNFPVSFNTEETPEGFSVSKKEDTRLFVNNFPGGKTVLVTRPKQNNLIHLLNLSYVILTYSIIILSFNSFLKKRNRRNRIKKVFHHSLRTRITVIITVILVIALVFMAVSSVVFLYKYINNNINSRMEERMLSVQSSLSKIARTSEQYNKLNLLEVFNGMDLISKSTNVDINLFDPLGSLIRSTRNEIFNEYIVSTRMNPQAYREIVYNHKMHSVLHENISGLEYYSLYTPIYNEKGVLLAIANIPYFVNNRDFKYDAPSIIATIINLYILLIIGAILTGITIANSITRPLRSISKSMSEMDITNKAEHIDYKANDELGLLVGSYNKMIDDLDSKTSELAKREREEAWSSMARQIAHEIKNPLTPMKLSIQLLLKMKKNNIPGWEERFDKTSASLLEQIDILTNTANEFSNFAKIYSDAISNINLDQMIKEQIALFDTQESISLLYRCETDEDTIIKGRKTQLVRVLVNLITNSVQSIENDGSGTILITLDSEEQMYRVRVEDSGKGVSEENLHKLFTPNFTTKSSGTGIGLAICKTIIKDSNGDIFYSQSKELGGACFTILLPKLKEDL